MQEQRQHEGKLLTVSEVSVYLNIKQKTIYAMVGAGEIPHYRIGRLIRFHFNEIDEWLGGCRKGNKTETEQQKTKRKKKRVASRNNDLFDKIVTKIIDVETDKYYSPEYGKSDQIEGLRKEVNNGAV